MKKKKKGSKTAVQILFIMAVALLLIGWVNALNLTIARYLERGKEFGLRKVFRSFSSTNCNTRIT